MVQECALARWSLDLRNTLALLWWPLRRKNALWPYSGGIPLRMRSGLREVSSRLQDALWRVRGGLTTHHYGRNALWPACGGLSISGMRSRLSLVATLSQECALALL